jgi:hypothetical protein
VWNRVEIGEWGIGCSTLKASLRGKKQIFEPEFLKIEDHSIFAQTHPKKPDKC